MAKAQMSADWDRTAVMWATVANANRDTKRKPEPFKPEDVHPFRKPAEQQPVPIDALKALIIQYKHGK
jgi:hypothetical protein